MRNIPIVTKSLLIINIAAFLISLFSGHAAILGGRDLNDLFGLHFFLAPDFHLYQLITYMFMHGGWAHLFFNMFALWMFGCVVENVWGPKKFFFYYIFCGIGAGLCQEIAQFGQLYMVASDQISGFTIDRIFDVARDSANVLNLWTTVGASGAIYAILLAFGMLFPEQRIFIIPIPFPIKAKWFVMIYAAIELFLALTSSGDGVAHIAHLGGMLFGFLLIKYWKKHPYIGNDFGASKGQDFFNRMRNNWEQRKGSSFHTTATPPPRHESDWDYNRRKQQEQEEIDHILDKIRKSGYDSLSKSEKQKLFDSSKK